MVGSNPTVSPLSGKIFHQCRP
ncbi:MAG: hypothetical protein QOI79_2808, partial [Mycobacterium sp.]|nr:hypothetical protein [Mycobacterium sp.]